MLGQGLHCGGASGFSMVTTCAIALRASQCRRAVSTAAARARRSSMYPQVVQADDVADRGVHGRDVHLSLRRLPFQLPCGEAPDVTWNLSRPGMAPSCSN